ncbi:MAG: M20/M25/M40 family metallo-hydrolase [Armatimonadetes bacterium]|nr:M20/M25/M40 family metallo-hydrolase [Armatimonadota bacterium]
MVNVSRLRQTFLDLVHRNSPPGQEREAARYCAEQLRECGFVVQMDRAGNVIGQKAGRCHEAPRIFFSGHTDTVRPTDGLRVTEEEGVFRTGGDTILGADDKAALAEILEGVRILDESGEEHGDLQVILTTREEIGLLGARELAPEVIAGSIGFVLDASGPTGRIITAAPTHDTLSATFHGRAAHAGFAPENGISAIEAASRAVARMHLGRIDAETTANVGVFQGGVANNVVAPEAVVTLEARSRSAAALERQIEHMQGCLEEAARELGATLSLRREREYSGYCWAPDAPLVRIAADAWRSLDRIPTLGPTGGGSDASVFNELGVPTVVLSCGYRDAHTFQEHVSLADLISGAEWVVAIARKVADPVARRLYRND